MLRIIASLAAGLLASPLAQAAGPPSCADKPTQADMNICVSDKLSKADATLNQIYGQLQHKLDALGRHNLVAAEKAWIAFRDRECDLRTGYDTKHLENTGTIAPTLVGECRLTLTQQRTADLRAQVKCPGGDLSCPP